MLPVPFILLFIRRVFQWMKKSDRLSGIVNKLENRALNKMASMKRRKVAYRFELIAISIIVAIPLPGTGAWTGALIAALLNIRIRNATISILVGVLIAAAIVTGSTYGLFGHIMRVVGE